MPAAAEAKDSLSETSTQAAHHRMKNDWTTLYFGREEKFYKWRNFFCSTFNFFGTISNYLLNGLKHTMNWHFRFFLNSKDELGNIHFLSTGLFIYSSPEYMENSENEKFQHLT